MLKLDLTTFKFKYCKHCKNCERYGEGNERRIRNR